MLLLVAPGTALLLARLVPAMDPVLESPRFHVIVVSAIAACALVVALATAVAAARDRRPDHVLRALGCVCVGSFLLAHGLTTPGMLGQPLNLWVGRLGALALIGFAACLAASLRAGGVVSRTIARAPRPAMLIPTGAGLGFSAAIVADPTIWSGTQPVALEEQTGPSCSLRAGRACW